jgi:SAM-dependent methyltransferase
MRFVKSRFVCRVFVRRPLPQLSSTTAHGTVVQTREFSLKAGQLLTDPRQPWSRNWRKTKTGMNESYPPARCLLCNAYNGIDPAGFHQIFPQGHSTPALLDWWECRTCEGWFVHPVPSPEVIGQHLARVHYNDPGKIAAIARSKELLQRRILNELSLWTKPGRLLDFGCNFGDFMSLAREAAWHPCGFEPYAVAAEAAKIKGFQVCNKWSLDEAGFGEASFAAITVIDVFYYIWDPGLTLKTFHRLLMPGGVLAMRLTNKRCILGLVRSILSRGPIRDAAISRILQTQFHSISMPSLSRVIRNNGFNRIRVWPRASAAPWRDMEWQAKAAYLVADFLYFLSFTKINVSPGVLLFAQKPSLVQGDPQT